MSLDAVLSDNQHRQRAVATEREAFALFLFYGANVVAAGWAIFSAFTHPKTPLAVIIVETVAIFVGANLMAFFQWLRCRRRPVVTLTRKYVCRKLIVADLLGAVLLLALYERGASSAYLWFVGGLFALADAVIVAEYLWQRSFRARLRQHGLPPRAEKPTTGR